MADDLVTLRDSKGARMGRALAVDGLANARHLGGLRRRDGSLTPRGVFYRSENVDRVTQAGWEQVRAAGIRTIVDLRQPGERAADTGSRPDWVATRQVDLDGLENHSFWKDYWDNGLVGTALYFRPHLRTMPERSGAALAAIITAPPGGVLFHCMGGQDRTGMIAMLLLAAIDTDIEDIVDDYLETVRLGDLRAATSNRNSDEALIEELCQSHGSTTEDAFRSVVTGLQLSALLASAGLTDQEIHGLRTWRGAVRTQPPA